VPRGVPLSFGAIKDQPGPIGAWNPIDVLRVDVAEGRRLLECEPMISIEEGLARTARWLEGEAKS